jgi:hypothetical protein
MSRDRCPCERRIDAVIAFVLALLYLSPIGGRVEVDAYAQELVLRARLGAKAGDA